MVQNRVYLLHIFLFSESSLHQSVMCLLTQLLTTLAVSHLKLTDHELQLITNYLPSLPADISSWPQYLGSSRAHKVHLPIIVYFFFVFAASKRLVCTDSCYFSVFAEDSIRIKLKPNFKKLKLKHFINVICWKECRKPTLLSF